MSLHFNVHLQEKGMETWEKAQASFKQINLEGRHADTIMAKESKHSMSQDERRTNTHTHTQWDATLELGLLLSPSGTGN